MLTTARLADLTLPLAHPLGPVTRNWLYTPASFTKQTSVQAHSCNLTRALGGQTYRSSCCSPVARSSNPRFRMVKLFSVALPVARATSVCSSKISTNFFYGSCLPRHQLRTGRLTRGKRLRPARLRRKCLFKHTHGCGPSSRRSYRCPSSLAFTN